MQNFNDDKDNYHFGHTVIHFVCISSFDFAHDLKHDMGHINLILQKRTVNF